MARPLVHMVIPLIDNLTANLEQVSHNEARHIAVRAGALAGGKVLNKYYSKTDDSVIYRLAMCKAFLSLVGSSQLTLHLVMHPRYKLDYFKRNQWPEDWIDTVRRMAREHYTKHYNPSVVSGEASTLVRSYRFCATADIVLTGLYDREHQW